jgi:hypothetical protein
MQSNQVLASTEGGSTPFMDTEHPYMKYVLPAALTLVVSLSVGIVLWELQRDRQEMTYELVESEAFPKEGGIGRYFIVRLENSGNTAVESIQLQVSFADGVIELAKFSSPDLVPQVRKDSSSITCTIPLLNPDEILSVTMTTSGEKNISSPIVLARARGVTALPKSKDSIPSVLVWLVIGTIAAVLINGLSSFLFQARRKEPSSADSKHDDFMKQIDETTHDLKKRNEEAKLGKPASEQLIFSLLNRSGLSHLVPEILSTGDSVPFWRTGLLLMHSFLLDEDNQDKFLDAMKALVTLEMAPSSLGFNLYLLAKMEHFIGKNEDASQHLDKCKKEIPAMYEHLMSQDLSFDLHRLQDSLKAKEKKGVG